MTKILSTKTVPARQSKLQKLGTSSFALALFLSQITPAFATIDNSAIVNGTYGGTISTFGPSTAAVPVVPASASLTISKAAGAPTTSVGDVAIVDAGDTITFTYTVKNTGNVTLTNVTPVDVGPTFNAIVGTGTMSVFTATVPATALPVTLAPNATQVFQATYTLSTLDTYRAAGVNNGVANTSDAQGKMPSNLLITSTVPGTATTTIPAGPKLTVSKIAALDDIVPLDGKAAVGEFIDYTYTVKNVGNVAMTNIKIADTHEGTPLAAGVVKNETLQAGAPFPGSHDETPSATNNGTWDTLAAGATVVFTYHHLVTQAEVDGG